MGKKYIIDLEDSESVYKTIITNGYPMLQVIVPAPYTELDLDAVKKEAYQRGYEQGYNDGYNEPGKNQQEAYQRGLNDAWEVSRKITKMNDKEASAIFGTWLFQKIFEGNSAYEAIEKLQEHEQDLIKMGDEVLYEDSKGVVIAPEENGHWAAVFTAGGERICVPDYKLRKTGKHYPEIANIVRELRKK